MSRAQVFAGTEGPERVVLEEDAFDWPEDVSPDQKYLVYVRAAADRNAGTALWALPLFGVALNFGDWRVLHSSGHHWLCPGRCVRRSTLGI